MDKLYRKKLEKIFNRVDKLATKGRDQYIEYYKYIDELIQKGDYGVFQQMLYYFYEIDILDESSVEDVKNGTWEDILFQTNTSFLKKLSLLYKQRGVYQDSYDIYTTDLSSISINLSDPLSLTFSSTGLTPSIHLEKEGDIINMDLYEPDIYNVQIYRSVWIDETPTDNELIQNINVGTQSSFQTQIPLTHPREYLITTYQRGATGSPGHYNVYNYKVEITRDAYLGKIIEIDTYSPDVKYLIQNQQYARLIGEVRYFLEVHKNGNITIIDEENPSLSFDQNLLNKYNAALDILLS